MKTTLEEKLKYVRLHLDEGVPIFEIQEKYGLDCSTLKYYCALYRKWGDIPSIYFLKRIYEDASKVDDAKVLRLTPSIELISLLQVWTNISFATSNLDSDVLLNKLLGHPPLQIANINSSIVSLDSTNSKLFPLNKSIKDTSPVDSPLSYKDMGYILKVDMRAVPVWGVSISIDEEPVKM